jgi:hypothetical protein
LVDLERRQVLAGFVDDVKDCQTLGSQSVSAGV